MSAFPFPPSLEKRLHQREQRGLLRMLPHPSTPGLIDFCSNDYLGLARSETLATEVEAAWQQQEVLLGATGSRLLSGNTELAESLEAELAAFHRAPAGLLFNSGYDANLGLLASVPRGQDTILYDEWVHASLHDGMKLSRAARYSFRHNDLDDLEAKIRAATGSVFVVIESIYSMDGDIVPLEEIVKLTQSYGGYLIIDEAHSTGILGAQGEGLTASLGLESQVFARVHTFGKAMGAHGAIVLGSERLRSYLINYARSFIYSTALGGHSLIHIQQAYRYLKKHPELMTELQQRIESFQENLQEAHHKTSPFQATPIQWIHTPGNKVAKQKALDLRDQGFEVYAILSPTVPRHQERIRICLHCYNSTSEIKNLLASIAS